MQAVVQAIVVGQGDVEGILFGDESGREVATAGVGIGVIKAAVIFLPVDIPRGFVVGSRVTGSGFFSDPEDRGGDGFLPRVNGLLLDVEGVFGGCFHRDLWPVLGGGPEGGNDSENGGSANHQWPEG